MLPVTGGRGRAGGGVGGRGWWGGGGWGGAGRGARISANGLSVNVTNQDGFSPLHMAALHGRTDLVPLLLKHGAYSGARNTSQAVPLHLACQQGHFQVWAPSPG